MGILAIYDVVCCWPQFVGQSLVTGDVGCLVVLFDVIHRSRVSVGYLVLLFDDTVHATVDTPTEAKWRIHVC